MYIAIKSIKKTLGKYIEIVCAYGAYQRNIVGLGAGNAVSHRIQ